MERAGASERLRRFQSAFEAGNRAWNEGDFEQAYGALPPDFAYDIAPTWPNARPLRGPGEIVLFFQDLRETFPDVEATGLEFMEVGERTMIVGFRVVGTGRISGAGTEMEIWQVWELSQAGTPIRVSEFLDREAALAACGAKGTRERRA